MNPIMQPIINKYTMLYVAHPCGGNLNNIARAEIQLFTLRKLLPRHTLISPIHNWSYLDYEMSNQVAAISDCVSLLLRCDALILTGRWEESAGCRAEYIAAKVKGLPVFTFDGDDLQSI